MTLASILLTWNDKLFGIKALSALVYTAVTSKGNRDSITKKPSTGAVVAKSVLICEPQTKT